MEERLSSVQMAEQFPALVLLNVGEYLWQTGRSSLAHHVRRLCDAEFQVTRRADVFAPSLPGLRVSEANPGDISEARERGLCDVSDETIYRTHNITRPTSGHGFTAVPNTPDLQCQCDPCKRYRRANARTGVAGPE